MWDPGSEAAAWAGGSHGAGSETVSYDLSWFLASGVRSYSGGPDIFASGVVGGEKKRERQRSDRRARRWRFPPKRNERRITLMSQRHKSLCFDRSSLRRDYQPVSMVRSRVGRAAVLRT